MSWQSLREAILPAETLLVQPRHNHAHRGFEGDVPSGPALPVMASALTIGSLDDLVVPVTRPRDPYPQESNLLRVGMPNMRLLHVQV